MHTQLKTFIYNSFIQKFSSLSDKSALQKFKFLLQKNWPFYLTGFIAVLGLKCFYSQASVSELNWILAPSVWWVRTLSDISFLYEPYEGYVSHTYQLVIAPSCSGMQFLIITLATLIFSFVHRMDTKKKKLCWMAGSLLASYAMTILVNTMRIILSIYLPLYLEKKSLSGDFLTPERLHTLIGTFVYFTSLFLLYHLTGLVIHHPFDRCLPPVFFYLTLVLGVPFLNRAYKNNQEQFTEYAMLIICVCLVVLALFFFLRLCIRLLHSLIT